MELAGARVIVAKVEPGVLKLELVVLSVLYFPVSWVRPYSQVKNRALKELRVETHFLGEKPAWPLCSFIVEKFASNNLESDIRSPLLKQPLHPPSAHVVAVGRLPCSCITAVRW